MPKDVSQRVLFALALALAVWGAYTLNEAIAQSTSQATVETHDGVIRFMIDGQEKARIDSIGLHVNGGLVYTGTTTDANAYLSRSSTSAMDEPQ